MKRLVTFVVLVSLILSAPAAEGRYRLDFGPSLSVGDMNEFFFEENSEPDNLVIGSFSAGLFAELWRKNNFSIAMELELDELLCCYYTLDSFATFGPMATDLGVQICPSLDVKDFTITWCNGIRMLLITTFNETIHPLPLFTTGVNLQYRFNEKWGIGTGFDCNYFIKLFTSVKNGKPIPHSKIFATYTWTPED